DDHHLDVAVGIEQAVNETAAQDVAGGDAAWDGDENVHTTCSNSYGSETRPSSSSASISTPLPWPVTANRGPAVTWSYDASWWLSEIESRRTYCRGRSGRLLNRHSTAPSPSTRAGTPAAFDVAVVTTRPESTSRMATWNTGRSTGCSVR